MKTMKCLGLFLLMFVLSMSHVGCSENDDNITSVVGSWVNETNGEILTLVFESDGTGFTTLEYNDYSDTEYFIWEQNGKTVTVTIIYGENDYGNFVFTINGNKLISYIDGDKIIFYKI